MSAPRVTLSLAGGSEVMVNCQCGMNWCKHREVVIEAWDDVEEFWLLIEGTREKALHMEVPIIPNEGLFLGVTIELLRDVHNSCAVSTVNPQYPLETIRIGTLMPGDGIASLRSMCIQIISAVRGSDIECSASSHSWREEREIVRQANNQAWTRINKWSLKIYGRCVLCEKRTRAALADNQWDPDVVTSGPARTAKFRSGATVAGGAASASSDAYAKVARHTDPDLPF